MNRRDFLGWCGIIGVAAMIDRARASRVELWFTNAAGGPDSSTDVRRGTMLGIEEAMRAASLFGGGVTVRDPRAGDEVFPSYGIWIWIVETSAGVERMQSLIDRSRGNGRSVVFSADDSSDALRGTCERGLFHIAPRRDGARDVVVWSDALTRFGADTLNKRFTSRFNAPMTPGAWAGWFAVKVAWEAALKSKAASAGDIISYLEKPTSRFDGHKGVGLYFDANHELVQPLYVMDGGKVREELLPRETASTSASCR